MDNENGDSGIHVRQLSRTDSKLIEATLRKELTQQLKSLRSLNDDKSIFPSTFLIQNLITSR